MKVLIDTSYALRGHSGTATYLAHLVAALPGAGVEVGEAADPKRRPPAGGGLGSLRNLMRDALWLQGELTRLAAGHDVLHHALPATSSRLGPGTAQVITVHDLAFVRRPQDFAPRFAKWATKTHRAAALAAHAIVVPSQTTYDDLVELWSIEADKVVVAPHGADHAPGQTTGQRAEHLLYVGDDEPRKRVPFLLDAHLAYQQRGGRLPLRLAGRAGDRVDSLDELLRGAAAVVSASAYEGFGLPLVEAMRAGVPVIATHAPGVSETVGDAGLLVGDAELPAALAKAEDALWRTRWGARGAARVQRLTWSASAEAHAAAYALAVARAEEQRR